MVFLSILEALSYGFIQRHLHFWCCSETPYGRFCGGSSSSSLALWLNGAHLSGQQIVPMNCTEADNTQWITLHSKSEYQQSGSSCLKMLLPKFNSSSFYSLLFVLTSKNEEQLHCGPLSLVGRQVSFIYHLQLSSSSVGQPPIRWCISSYQTRVYKIID